jgi:hypothetical protein
MTFDMTEIRYSPSSVHSHMHVLKVLVQLMTKRATSVTFDLCDLEK